MALYLHAIHAGNCGEYRPQPDFTLLMQAVRMQVTIEQEVANAKEMKGLSRILVKLLTSHKDVSPFHIQTIMHRSDLDKLRDDEGLKECLTEVIAEARERPDLGAAAQKLLQVRHADIPAHRKPSLQWHSSCLPGPCMGVFAAVFCARCPRMDGEWKL